MNKTKEISTELIKMETLESFKIGMLQTQINNLRDFCIFNIICIITLLIYILVVVK